MPVITSGFNQNLFSGQGEVFMGKRDSNSRAQNAFYIGNCPKVEISLNVERRKHKESTSGQRQIDKIQTTTKGGRIVLTLEDIALANMKAMLAGTEVNPSGTLSGSTYDTFASALVVGDIVWTKFKNLSSIVVKDSAVSPATLVLDTDYSVLDAARGIIKILNLGTYVQPFRAQYTYAATKMVPAFEGADDQEWQLLCALVNTEANPDQKIDIEVYRVIWDPAKTLALINEEGGSFDFEGEILRDITKAADSNYGGFMRVAYVNANS